MNYYQQIQEKYGSLDPDKEQVKHWYKEGFEALKNGETDRAETSFEKLAVAKPWQHSGFEGLAYVYYDQDRLKESEWFMMKAMSIAEGLEKRGVLDEKIIKLMQHNLQAMREEKKIFRWWESSKS
jgi:hypothetical protein